MTYTYGRYTVSITATPAIDPTVNRVNTGEPTAAALVEELGSVHNVVPSEELASRLNAAFDAYMRGDVASVQAQGQVLKELRLIQPDLPESPLVNSLVTIVSAMKANQTSN
jgi:hypothetical protein